MTSLSVTRKPPPASTVRRRERYAARHVLWNLSNLRRVRACGRCSRLSDGAVTVRVSTSDGARSAGFGGLQHCGSVWSCPVCSAKVAASRQADVERALGVWGSWGGSVGLLTLTMRHRDGQRLEDLWAALSGAWGAVTSGRGWKRLQRAYGTPLDRVIRSGRRAGEIVRDLRIPYVRVVESTHGENGWHLHVHALLFLRAGLSPADVRDLECGIFARWSASLVGSGLDAPTLERGADLRLVTAGDAALSEYVTKSTYGAAALETVRGDLKDARRGNRTPFGILRGLVQVHATGDLGGLTAAQVARDEALWAEWEAASKGRRQLTWSVGLRDLLLPGEAERTDEEIADEDAAGETEAVLPRDVWRGVVAARVESALLDAWEMSAARGTAYLRSLGLLDGDDLLPVFGVRVLRPRR